MLAIQTPKLIKTQAHKSPISGACHLHDKMLQPQTTSLGSSHTCVAAQKACQTVCIITYILSICMDMQTDAMKLHQPYLWTIGSMQSAASNAIPTLWPSFLPL